MAWLLARNSNLLVTKIYSINGLQAKPNPLLLNYYSKYSISEVPKFKIYAYLDNEKKEIINSNFFHSEIDMRRKK